MNVQSDWNQSDSTADDYIKNKPNIPAGVIVDSALSSTSTNPVQNKVINTALSAKGTYSKPSGGIPKTDLATAVQTSLGKADSALQSFTETDPTVPSWAKAETKPSYTYSEVGAAASSHTHTKSQITDFPTIPTVGTLVTNATTAQTASSGESMGSSITLHKVSKTGSYSDLLNKPTIPTVNNASLTIQKNSTTIGTFTANASADETINLTVPTALSELTDDTTHRLVTDTEKSTWNGKTSNTGTVTSIAVKMNNTTKGTVTTSGTIDLGTVITSETSLSKGTTSGSGNAVTDISVSGHQITLTKGSTFLTSHQSLAYSVSNCSDNPSSITLDSSAAHTYQHCYITSRTSITLSGGRANEGYTHYILFHNSGSSDCAVAFPSGDIAPDSTVTVPHGSKIEISYTYSSRFSCNVFTVSAELKFI